MLTYLVQRAIPPAFRFEDPAILSQHARWALDTYRKVGANWLGGLITDDGMFSLVVTEREQDLHEYTRILGFDEREMVLRRVLQMNGPSFAGPQS